VPAAKQGIMTALRSGMTFISCPPAASGHVYVPAGMCVG